MRCGKCLVVMLLGTPFTVRLPSQFLHLSHDAHRIDALVGELFPQATAAFLMRAKVGKFRPQPTFQQP